MKCIGRNGFNCTQKSSVKSRFTELDKITGGWNNGDLIVVGGRPAMGKTAFGMSMLRNISIRNRIPTAFFSLEYSTKQLIDRFCNILSRVECGKTYDYQEGDASALSKEELLQIEDAKKQIDIAPIYFDDTPALTMQELYKKTIRLISDFQVKLIVVDYLQLMSGSGLSYSNRQEAAACIVRGLKTLAKNLNVPIVAFSQLNRGIENRGDINEKRPQLNDFGEFQTIEQDADVVCFIHRPEYYRIYTDENGNDLRGIAEIIVAKNRNGKTGDIRLKFDCGCRGFETLYE